LFVEALKKAREAVRLGEVTRAGESEERKPGDDVVITTLGTGSSLPSKYRNGEPIDLSFLFAIPRIVSSRLASLTSLSSTLLFSSHLHFTPLFPPLHQSHQPTFSFQATGGFSSIAEKELSVNFRDRSVLQAFSTSSGTSSSFSSHTCTPIITRG